MPEFSCGGGCSSAAAKAPDRRSARRRPVEIRRSASETRGLMKANRGAGFFFMGDFLWWLGQFSDTTQSFWEGTGSFWGEVYVRRAILHSSAIWVWTRR